MSEIRERLQRRINEAERACAGKTGLELKEAQKRIVGLRLCLLIHDTLVISDRAQTTQEGISGGY